MKKVMMIIAALVVAASCADPKAEKVEALKTETIAIHDEVMPRMGELNELAMALKKTREEIKEDTTDEAISKRRELSERIEALEVADEAMMSWMHDYEPMYEDQHPLDSAVVYYEKERDAITRVKELMEKSIEDGEKVVEANKK